MKLHFLTVKSKGLKRENDKTAPLSTLNKMPNEFSFGGDRNSEERICSRRSEERL
jgi:hypothetical protein